MKYVRFLRNISITGVVCIFAIQAHANEKKMRISCTGKAIDESAIRGLTRIAGVANFELEVFYDDQGRYPGSVRNKIEDLVVNGSLKPVAEKTEAKKILVDTLKDKTSTITDSFIRLEPSHKELAASAELAFGNQNDKALVRANLLVLRDEDHGIRDDSLSAVFVEENEKLVVYIAHCFFNAK